MEVIIQNTPEEASRLGALLIAKLIRDKPNAALGLATGSTPVRLYRELIKLHLEEGLDFSNVTTFNLDEYVGLGADNSASYRSFMHENLFRYVNVPAAQIHIPDGLAKDIPAHCNAYEQSIRDAGGIDLQVLGIGTDGHIGFNEPSSSLASRTRIKTLTPETRRNNAPFFVSEEAVPHHVITMGVGTIMDARSVLMLAFGQNKAKAVAAAVEGPITASVPASILQMHPTAKTLIDEPAAEQLSRPDYYRWVYSHKPAWQQVDSR